MSDDKLATLIKSRTDADIISFFNGLGEPERAEYRDDLLASFRDLLEQYRDFSNDRKPDHKTVYRAGVAVAATATFSQIKALGWRAHFVDSDSCFAVLANRNPKWLADWCAWLLDERLNAWPMVRRFVKEGLIDEPDTESYVLGLIEAFGFGRENEIYGGLKKDPDLLGNLVWRLFEVEGGGETSLANHEKYLAVKSGGGWTGALLQLSEEGLIDRQRLLDASLDALNRDFSQYRAGWFSRFHEELKPTLAERAARVDKYLSLLASQIGPTVSFALKALQIAQKGGQLDLAAFIAAAGPAMFTKSAGSVKIALNMLVAAIAAKPELADSALEIIAAGLEHSNVDIQRLSLDAIVAKGSPKDNALRSAIESRMPVISATLKSQAQAFLGANAAEPETDPVMADRDELLARADRIPDCIRQMAGLNHAVAALKSGGANPGRAMFGSQDIPRLRSLTPMSEIKNVADLVDAALHVFANPNDIDLAEQVIGSASSMRPETVPDLIAPLAAKLKKMVRPPLFVREGEATARSLFIVLCAWLKPFGFSDDEADSAVEELARIVNSKPGSAEINIGLEVILLRRAFCLADLVSRGKTATLLSLPSHAGGWIDPKRLVKRSRSWAETGEAMIPEDQIVALLRLAPDGRGDALKAAAGIDGEWGSALRYALGGDEAVGESVALWVAAARARDPSGDDLKVEEKWPGLGAGGGKAGHISTTVSWSSSEYDGKTYHHYDFLAAVTPQGALAVDQNLPPRQRAMRGKIWRGKSDLALLPTVMAHDLPDCPGLSGYFRHPLVTDWAISVWPSYPDFSYTAAALMIGRYDGEPRNVSDPLPAGYKLFLDPDVPLTETGVTMICRALNDSDPGDQQSGADALVQTIEDGRLDAAGFGGELHRLLLTGIILPKRSAPRLREVAEISPLHRLTICKALEQAMRGGVPLRPFRDLHAWLDLLLELLTETGEAIEDEMTKAFLKSLSGTSKAAKTARKLLVQKAGNTDAMRSAAALHAIEMRLDRAERWI